MKRKANWQNRIVEYAEYDPRQLQPHPLNWRRHSRVQSRALGRALDSIGWAKPIIVNRRTGHIIDGHLRVELAREQEQSIPAIVVDVDEEEEKILLATLDPLSAMAHTDYSALEELLQQTSHNFHTLLKDVWKERMPEISAKIPEIPRQWLIVVECASEEEQVALLERFLAEGLQCRALIS